MTPVDSVCPPNWYVVRTRSRHERVVRDQLEARSIDAFLPVYDRWSRWKDRRKKLEAVLFPGYCFARFPLVERFRVLGLVGVSGLVGIGGTVEPVPELEIDALRRLTTTRLQCDPHPFLEEGMDVEIVHGPLAGVRGKLLRKDNVTKLVISVTLIRQAAVVHVHPSDVAAV